MAGRHPPSRPGYDHHVTTPAPAHDLSLWPHDDLSHPRVPVCPECLTLAYAAGAGPVGAWDYIRIRATPTGWNDD